MTRINEAIGFVHIAVMKPLVRLAKNMIPLCDSARRVYRHLYQSPTLQGEHHCT